MPKYMTTQKKGLRSILVFTLFTLFKCSYIIALLHHCNLITDGRHIKNERNLVGDTYIYSTPLHSLNKPFIDNKIIILTYICLKLK